MCDKSESDVELPSGESDVDLPPSFVECAAAKPEQSEPELHDDMCSLPSDIESDIEMPPSMIVDTYDSEDSDVPVPKPYNATLALDVGRQDIAEFYSPRRVLPQAWKLGLLGVFSLDLLTGWDLKDAATQKLSIDLLMVFSIFMVILSPPCTAFSALMHMWNYKKMSTQKGQALWESGMGFLKHSMQAAVVQLKHGRLFAFEHPASAISWDQACVQEVMAMPGVMTVTFDQCTLGLMSPVRHLPMRKRTRILTNSHHLVNRLQHCRCDGTHVHQRICGAEDGVQLSTWAQCYPPGLVNVLVEAVRDELHAKA